jgi:hypothetical protein
MNTSLGARTWSQVEQSTDIEVLGVPVEPTRKKQKLNPDLSMENVQEKMEIILEKIEQYSAGSLPPEIILQIFDLLPRNDLTSASLVCHSWLQISKDETVTWLNILDIELLEDFAAFSYACQYPEARKYLPVPNPSQFKDLREKMAASGKDPKTAIMLPPPERFNIDSERKMHLCLLLDQSGKLMAVTRYACNIRWAPDLTNDCYRYSIRLVWKNSDFQTNRGYAIQIEVNPRRIERPLRQGEQTHQCVPFFANQALEEVKKINLKDFPVTSIFYPKNTYQPAVLPLLSEQPEELTGVKMHNYQLNALTGCCLQKRPKKSTFFPLCSL